MKENKLKVRYYKDKINDDFAGTNIKQIELPDDYKYVNKNFFYRAIEIFLYWIFAKPLIWLYTKITIHQKFINKKVIKKVGKEGFFLYGNHTMLAQDAFIPNILAGRKNFIIVNPDAVSIKGIKTIVKMLGALPLPTSLKSHKYFIDAINYHVDKGSLVTIYPEAHIWTYYTSIRPFSSASFKYPVNMNKPVFCFTNVFVKSKLFFRKKPAVRTYIDGPFYPDTTLNKVDANNKLRDEVYNTMVKRCEQHPKYKYKYDYIESNY